MNTLVNHWTLKKEFTIILEHNPTQSFSSTQRWYTCGNLKKLKDFVKLINHISVPWDLPTHVESFYVTKWRGIKERSQHSLEKDMINQLSVSENPNNGNPSLTINLNNIYFLAGNFVPRIYLAFSLFMIKQNDIILCHERIL